MSAIEVLKTKNNPCDVCKYDNNNSCGASGGEFGECKPAEEFYNAIQTALLALESLDRLEKWLNKKYDENWFVLTNNKDLEEARIIRNFIKEVREVLEKEGVEQNK
jgi:hypothetical protein